MIEIEMNWNEKEIHQWLMSKFTNDTRLPHNANLIMLTDILNNVDRRPLFWTISKEEERDEASEHVIKSGVDKVWNL